MNPLQHHLHNYSLVVGGKFYIQYMEDNDSIKEHDLKQIGTDILQGNLNLINYIMKWSYSNNQ